LLKDQWNFHHPTLMLVTAKLASQIFRTPADDQPMVELGRWVSAAFAAAGVTAIALLGFWYRGFAGFFGVGLILGLHHQVFELAHYFKEDTALLAGLALSFLALAIFEERRTRAGALLLGAACGLSVSAKYIGIIAAIPAVIVIACAPEPRNNSRRTVHALFFLAGFIVVCAVANYPLLANFQTFESSFHREIALATGGKGDVARSVPHSEYLRAFVVNTNLALWLLLAAFLVRFWKTRRERSLTQWCAVIFPVAFAAALSFSPKANDRYFLPCTALFGFLAGLGVADAAAILRDRARLAQPLALGICLATVAVFQVLHFPPIIPNSLAEYFQAFAHDDRSELADWILKNLPPDAVIAQDTWVSLPTPDRPARLKVQTPLPQKIIGGRTALPDLGGLADLTRQGVTHVVISENDYGRYRRAAVTAREKTAAEFLRKKEFYDALLGSGPPLWERSRGAVIYLHPGLRVYRL
jgi:hypothetical protein